MLRADTGPVRLRRHIAYLGLFLVPFATLSAIARGSSTVLGSPGLLSAFVAVTAVSCVVVSSFLLRRAFLTDAAELAWTALFFLTVSLLSLVHGLTTPGTIYGPNAATTNAELLAIPLGTLAAMPTFAARYGRVARAWKPWSVLWVGAATTVSVLMLWLPGAVPAFDPASTTGLMIQAACLVAGLLFGERHVRLAAISERRAPIAVTAGFSLTLGSIASHATAAPYSLASWSSHLMLPIGVLLATVAAFTVYRRSASMSAVLAPVVAVEPRAALEVGMNPAVVSFVDTVDTKDLLTRDHIIRVAELAMEVAKLMRLPVGDVRCAGLVGALHDIGKVQIPDKILDKSGPLDKDEWEIVRSHAAIGGDLVAACPSLANLASSVRGHHERVDGQGYPDGLAGESIPLVARIVSACDAFDAMAYTRRYRSAMELDDVVATLQTHAGTQWDPLVVRGVVTVVSRRTHWEPQLMARGHVDGGDCFSAIVGSADDYELHDGLSTLRSGSEAFTRPDHVEPVDSRSRTRV